MISKIANIFDLVTVAPGGDTTSVAINITNVSPDAKFYFDLDINHNGTGALSFLIGDTEDGSFYEPASNSIAAGHTKTTNTSGRDRYTIAMEGTLWIIFKLEETGGASDIIASGDFYVNDKV